MKTMKQMIVRPVALTAVLMMSAMTFAQTDATNDSLSTDTTQWYNQTQELSGVVVKGRLPKTRVKGDAMRTTIAGTLLEKSGTLSDLLNKIPSVEAERDGAVKVMGRGEAEVYINGRKVQDKSELSRLRSDQIQHIDVVQNPGARYAASTKAVIRLTLKKAQGEGISFRDNAMGLYQYSHTLTNDLNVNYRTGGLDITGSFWAGRYGHGKSIQDNDLTYYLNKDHYGEYSTSETKNIWKGWSPQLQFNYMVNERHSFGAFYKYDRHPSGTLTSEFNTDNYVNDIYTERSESWISQEDSFRKHIFNAYYNGKLGKLGIDWNIDGLFDKTKTPGSTKELKKAVTGDEEIRTIENNTNSSNNFWATKLVMSYPVWQGNFSLGGEYSHNHRTDAYSYVSDHADVSMTPTDTEINESSTAAFAEYGRAFGKVFAQVGLRYEHITNDYYNFGKRQDEVCRNYGDWFPTLVLSAPVGKVQLSLSYRRDIQRPHYSQLTSSTIYINRYTYQSGNPYLKPTYTHSVVLNGAYQWANVVVNYGRIKDMETMSTEPYPGSKDPLVSLVRPINSSEDYNQLSIVTSLRPVIGCWHPTWSCYTLFQDYKSLSADGTMITLNRPYVYASWKNDIELSRSIRLYAGMDWQSKGDYNNFRMTRTKFMANLGFQHDINLRELGSLTIDMKCYDVFNTGANNTIVYGIREITAHNPARRTFMLDLTWKFNEARSKYRGSGAGEKQKARM